MRYIGNKLKMLDEIDNLLHEKDLYKKGLVFCDAFSGTATVANHYNGFYRIISNDILSLAYEMSAGLLTYRDTKFKKLGFNPFEYFESINTDEYITGFCYNHFSPNGNCKYFSDENAKYIDYIRDTIDVWENDGKLDSSEKSYLIMCLLEAVSKVSNVAGVYSAYLKSWDPRATKRLKFVPIEVKKHRFTNKVYCEDANNLLKNIKGDILYLDPPYTPTQYNSQYHTLETIARNDFPKTHGIGKHRDNDRLSKWCKKGYVEFEFETAIKNAKFKHIIFSYSDKGLMSAKFIESVLKRYAKPGTFTFKKIDYVKYKNTRAVDREMANGTQTQPHYEYLFYIEKKEEFDVKYVSPLNYIGGKYQALDLIKTNMPNNIENFYDIFGGGATVGININAKKVYYSDINNYVVSLLEYLSITHPVQVYNNIQKLIKKYGLKKENKKAYYRLRDDYNLEKTPELLYLLICYGFEHQIRFNSKHEFNNPCGNSGFNDEMYEKLISYYLRCNSIKIAFKCCSYEKNLKKLKINDFVYLDPPYLSADGVYQDGKRGYNGWDLEQEKKMYRFIEKINKKGIRFMLSNCLEHVSDDHSLLLDWANQNSFNVIIDERMTKRNRQNRREIIITNFKLRL